MKLFNLFVSASVVIILLPTLLFAQQDLSVVKQKADSLYDAYQEEQALELYRDILDKEPENYKALWRTSFLYSRVGNRFENKDDQKKYYNSGIELAEKALEIDSTEAQSNFVKAVAMGRKALISGVRDRVGASREIKKYADRTIEIDPEHAGAWHVLGRWHFKVANLSWVERTAANTLFGGIPGDASNQKAVDAFQKAIDLNDDYVLYYYDLAKVYEEMGSDSQAIATCENAVEKENLTPDDPMLKEKCRKLIYDLR